MNGEKREWVQKGRWCDIYYSEENYQLEVIISIWERIEKETSIFSFYDNDEIYQAVCD